MPFFVPQAVPLTSCGTSNKVARGAGAGEAEVFLFTLSLSLLNKGLDTVCNAFISTNWYNKRYACMQ